MIFHNSICCLRLPLFLSVLGMFVSGCESEDGIRQYTVQRATQAPVTSSGQSWFFKVMGPRASVLAQEPAFREMVQSVKFDAQGKPSYPVPANWKRQSGPAPRLETIIIGEGESALELTVSSLNTPGEDVSGYQLANVNRWREQLGLPALTGTDWLIQGVNAGEIVDVGPHGGNAGALVVKLTGQTEKIPEAATLAALVTAPRMGPAAQPAANPPNGMNAPPGMNISSAAAPFDHTPPEHWKPAAGNNARLASLQVDHSAGKLDVSVTRFPNGGELLDNVNRWRLQVSLPEIGSQNLPESVTALEIGGKPAKLVIARGPEQSILAAIVPDGSAQWFFKLQGPTAGVTAEEQNFRNWLNTVKFKSP